MSDLRRSNFIESGLNYAEVGVSQAFDLIDFPPNGAQAFYRELQLGSGAQRFQDALGALMTWQAFRAAGITVEVLTEGTKSVTAKEAVYSINGVPYLLTGAQVSFTAEESAKNSAESKNTEFYRVVRLLGDAATAADHSARLPGADDRSGAQVSQRSGFILGSVSGTDGAGEISFEVSLRTDNTVWASVRGFWHEPPKRGMPLLSRGSKTPATDTKIAQLEQVLTGMTPLGVAAQPAE